jgi:hypothetical protein
MVARAIVTIVLAGCGGATDERERLAADARAAQALTDLAYPLFVGSESDASSVTRNTHALPR